MLDDGFEEEVVLIGGEALRTKTQTQYCTGSCLNHFFSRGILRCPWRCFRILDFTEWKKAQGLALQSTTFRGSNP
jgi:hypothetical protein